MAQQIRILALFGARVLFGQERANIETLGQLKERGCEVVCIVRDEDWPELKGIRKALEARGLKCVRLPHIDYPIRGWLLHAAKRNPLVFIKSNIAFLALIDRMQPTHIHAFNQFYVASFSWALFRSRVDLIYRCGDRPVLHNAFYRCVWRFVRWRSKYFVSDSNYIKKQLCSTGVPAEKISVIYAPAPKRVGAPPLPIVRMLDEPVFRFVYVGQITESKGVRILIDAFRIVARAHGNVHLLIAGRISNWSGDEWARNLRDEVGLDDLISSRIDFVGYVDKVAEVMARANVHVAPSLAEEGYGLVVVEAKEVRRPSIVFTSGGLAELVSDRETGLIAAEKTADALAKAMLTYVEDPDLARAHGDAAYQSIASLGILNFGDEWLKIYERTNVTTLEHNRQ